MSISEERKRISHTYIRSLDIAAMQLKLALQVEAAAHAPLQLEGIMDCDPFPQKLGGITYGKIHMTRDELRLSADDAALASNALKHCATFTLVVAIDSAIENIIPNRFDPNNSSISVAARIARIIRNAYTHNPFFPQWNCTNPNHIGLFSIPGIITLDTASINGMEVEWQDYGGHLALLLFLDHCKELLCSYLEEERV
jgi:hypothetical protein